jgi:outer membrane cobalamin receptor
VYSAGIEAAVTRAGIRWNSAALFLDDELWSTSLLSGPYRTRQHVKLSLVPEKSWSIGNGRTFAAKAGASYEDTDRDGAAVSPVAELSLDNLAPNIGLSRVYASYAKSTQTPTYFALKSNATRGLFRGNANLGRQRAHNFDVGAQAGSGAFTTSAAVFFRRDDRLIDWTYSASATNARTANAVDIDTTGFELVSRYSTKAIDAVLGYTALHKDEDYGSAAVDASFYALNFPKHRLTLALTARLGGGWEVRLDNEYRVQEKNALRKGDRTPLLSSAGVYYAVRQVPGLRLSAEVENLWDSDFQEVPAVPASRRQISFGAMYVW